MSAPWLSVVIPCYNSEAWIAEAVDSVLGQAVGAVQVVVVDDGSTDGSAAILSAYGNEITVITQQNSGVVVARRAGVEAATGQFIKFLDADDIVPAGALELLQLLAARHEEEVLIGRVGVFGDGIGDEHRDMYRIGYQPEPLAEVRREFLLTQATQSSAWMIPRAVFAAHDLFGNERIQMGEEFGFSMRLIATGVRIRYVDADVCLVRVHESTGRLSRSVDPARHLAQAEEINRAARFIRERIPDHSPDAFKQIARMCWSRGRSCLRIGCDQAADRYFALAREIDPAVVPLGSGLYRTLTAVTGPRASEWMLEVSKKAMTRRRTS